jgi:membrane protease YdiL (CAAX protease family)
MWLSTARIPVNPIHIRSPQRECLLWGTYFVIWLLLNMLLWRHVFGLNRVTSNGVSFWLLLVLIPGIVLWKQGYRFPAVGLTWRHLGKNLRATLLSGSVLAGLLIALTPGGRYLRSSMVTGTELLKGLLLSFALSLLFAAIHEEFFFRAVLQTRTTEYFHSRWSGLVVASICFGLYHLPFAYFAPGATQGNLAYSFASVMTEHMISAPMLGILWLRTRNLMAPICVHALINTISGFEMILEKFL